MNDIRRPLFAVVGLVLVVALSVLLWSRDGANEVDPTVTSMPMAVAMRFSVGDQRSFAFEMTSEVALDDGTASMTQRTHGVLHTRIDAVEVERVWMRAALSDVRVSLQGAVDDAASAALTDRALEVVMGVDGSIRSVEVLGALEPTHAAMAAEVVRTFQIVVPEDAGRRWTTRESHAAGEFAADYSWGGRSITKRKTGYSDPETSVLASRGEAVLADSGSWLESLELEESVEVTRGGRTMVTSVLRASLSRVEVGGVCVAWERAERPVEAPVAASRVVTDADLGTLRSLCAELDEIEGPANARMHALRDLLRECPELARAIPGELALRGDRAGATMLHALELAGNATCQEVLAEVANQIDGAPMHRLRALVSLGGVAEPVAETVSALWELHASRGDGASIDRSNTALLSLGRIAARGPDAELEARLVDAVRGATDPASRCVSLQAVANSGRPSMRGVVGEAFESPSARVRAAAAKAMARVGDERDVPWMTRSLRDEPDAEVRASLADSLRSAFARREDVSRVVADRLARETDTRARGALARYLADSLEAYPSGRAALEELMRTETDDRTRKFVAARLGVR